MRLDEGRSPASSPEAFASAMAVAEGAPGELALKTRGPICRKGEKAQEGNFHLFCLFSNAFSIRHVTYGRELAMSTLRPCYFFFLAPLPEDSTRTHILTQELPFLLAPVLFWAQVFGGSPPFNPAHPATAPTPPRRKQPRTQDPTPRAHRYSAAIHEIWGVTT